MVSIANQVVPPKLIFHKYADQYFLTQAWLKYSDEGREFFVTPRELQMAREYSQERVVLALVGNMGTSPILSLSPRYIGQLKPGKT